MKSITEIVLKNSRTRDWILGSGSKKKKSSDVKKKKKNLSYVNTKIKNLPLKNNDILYYTLNTFQIQNSDMFTCEMNLQRFLK